MSGNAGYGHGSGFALLVVLFILLVIVTAATAEVLACNFNHFKSPIRAFSMLINNAFSRFDKCLHENRLLHS